MGIKSNNLAAIYHDFFSRSGKDAVKPYVPPVPFSATGGDTTFVDGGYKYHVWTTNGAGSPFNITDGSTTVEYLVVAGGGGTGESGGGGAGGGGGGGLINSSSTFAPGSYAVTVGAGGAGSPSTAVTAGEDSRLGSFIAAGGGRGGHYSPSAGYQRGATSSAGGSSGGAVGNNDAGTANVFAPSSPQFPSPAPGQGNSGGPALPSSGNNTGGGGGGGAGGAGGNPDGSSIAGAGGIGAAIPWVPLNYGTPGPNASARYFAGGGGAGGQDLSGAPGGHGGGGNGTSRPPGASGTPGVTNTGGGAGGPGSAPGANGGPGIVIVRYETDEPESNIFGASGGTKIISGNDTYHVFLHTGSPQSFTVENAPGSLTAKVLVVGGGASGGFSADGISGGGGAGGVQYYTSYPITNGTTTVVVGNRGANPGSGPTYTPDPAINDGEDTTFGSAIGYGGGGGAHEFPGIRNQTGHNGGSAGGGASYPFPGTGGGSPTQSSAPLVSGAGGTNYGNDAGAGGNSNPEGYGGGGGGAGGDGQGRPNGANGGNGQAFPEFPGPVLAPAIPSINVSTIGPTGLFAGGGAGGHNGPTIYGPSPGGGGATAWYQANPSRGADATGYGSGGAGTQYGISNTLGSPAGSPGIVIVKYST